MEDVDATTDTIGYTRCGEWLNYTVDIREAGAYRATLHYGYPFAYTGAVKLYLDDKDEIASFPIDARGARNHVVDKTVSATLELPAGHHRLKVLFLGSPNVSFLDWERVELPL